MQIKNISTESDRDDGRLGLRQDILLAVPQWRDDQWYRQEEKVEKNAEQ